MNLTTLVEQSLLNAAGMFWSILWALILGFILSGIIMVFVPKKKMVALLGKPGPKELGLAMLLGAVSSSCSYAAASMTKSLFQKGAHIIPALAFLLASTNLVLELSLVLWVLLGWQFVLAEFLGGVILVFIMALLMRWVGPLEEFKKRQTQWAESPANHPGHGMTQTEDVANPKTLEGWREAARAFVNEWKMIWKDIVLGVLVSGILMTVVPDHIWQALFLQDSSGNHGVLKLLENAFMGPLVSVVSFVCSVGNIPLAGVLYHGGIGFGGAISFIFADLIIIPLILVYRKYFGWKLALWIFCIFYFSMALTGILVDLLFQVLGWIPEAPMKMSMGHENLFASGSTFWLNVIFILLGLAFAKLAKGHENHKSCCHS